MAADPSSTTLGGDEPPDLAWLRLPEAPFDLQVLPVAPSILVAVLRGRIDHEASPRLRDAVTAGLDAGAATLVFDLSEASFIDATALGVIVSAARRLGPDAVVLVVPYRGLRRAFRACGLDRALRICETRDEALRGLPSVQPKAAADVAAVTSRRRRPARDRTTPSHATASARRSRAV
jgi:anti-anti-sigma factor